MDRVAPMVGYRGAAIRRTGLSKLFYKRDRRL